MAPCYSALMKRRLITSREIGEAIRRRRRELGISQERLAEMLDVSYQQVQRYENGSNRLNVENIQLVADTLGVHVGYFFDSELPLKLAEPETVYSPEEKNLLVSFRKIEDHHDRGVVVGVARMAAKRSVG